MQALARFSGRKYLATRAKYCVSYQDAQGKDERGDGFRRKAGGTAQGARVYSVGTGGAGGPIAPDAGLLAYYEGQNEQPPTTHLPGNARALGVETDELLGLVAGQGNGTAEGQPLAAAHAGNREARRATQCAHKSNTRGSGRWGWSSLFQILLPAEFSEPGR